MQQRKRFLTDWMRRKGRPQRPWTVQCASSRARARARREPLPAESPMRAPPKRGIHEARSQSHSPSKRRRKCVAAYRNLMSQPTSKQPPSTPRPSISYAKCGRTYARGRCRSFPEIHVNWWSARCAASPPSKWMTTPYVTCKRKSTGAKSH